MPNADVIRQNASCLFPASPAEMLANKLTQGKSIEKMFSKARERDGMRERC